MPAVDLALPPPLPLPYPRLPTRRTFPTFDARAASYISSTSYSTHVPSRVQISPGVWSDGKDCVLSAAHPAVQALLNEARRTLQLSPASSDIVFTLAALDVFYKPGDPAHWLFWSDEKKLSTAKVVNRISLHQPPLIRSNVAWNGIPEYLSILANHHGVTWRHVYETQPWYQVIIPPKETTTNKVINLRKRKAAPGAFREPSRSPPLEEADIIDEPRPKRVRAQRPTSQVKKSTIDSSNNEASEPVASTSKQTFVPPANAVLPQPAIEQAVPTTPPTGSPAVLPDDVPQTEESLRASSRKRRKAPSRYPASVRSRESSSSPSDSLSLEHSAESSDARVRSSSHTSSETVVAPESIQGRSGSVSSSSTTVASANAKEQKADDMIIDDPQEGKAIEDSDSRSEGSVDSEGMVTRGRASRTRSDDSSSKKSGEENVSDVIPTSRAKTGRASGARARTKKTVKV